MIEIFLFETGYAFSDPAAKEGLNFLEVARMYKELMLRLGHKAFYTQGGDWGSSVTMAMAIMYPETILGYHTNFAMVPTLGGTVKTYLASKFPDLFQIPQNERFMLENLGREAKVYTHKNFS